MDPQRSTQSPQIPTRNQPNHRIPNENIQNSPGIDSNRSRTKTMFSPRFKSVAAMAGWDEEALLVASLVVEDTPDRTSKQKKRSDLQFKTPPSSNSRRKRRAQRRSAVVVPVTVLNLDDDDDDNSTDKQSIEKKKEESEGESKKTIEGDKKSEERNSASCTTTTSTPPCMDRLREELSCAICLEICFEPSTTPCGHSFCKKCLRSAADKCGKRCPKCRQLISNGRSCTVNTVLWNTIQLLFPAEVEARKAATVNTREVERPSSKIVVLDQSNNSRSNSSNHGVHATRRIRPVGRGATSSNREEETQGWGSRRQVPSQDIDAALALRLQREEFMEIHRGGSSLARANLRAMAQRAINLRHRTRPV